MNRKIYRKLAKKHGVTVAEVKKDMQEAINTAYTDSDRDLINIYAQNSVPRKGDIPTPDEMIRFVATEVRKKSSI